jgi:hypothetical protein
MEASACLTGLGLLADGVQGSCNAKSCATVQVDCVWLRTPALLVPYSGMQEPGREDFVLGEACHAGVLSFGCCPSMEKYLSLSRSLAASSVIGIGKTATPVCKIVA